MSRLHGYNIRSRPGVPFAQPIFSRALSGLFIKIAYGDALSQHAIDELVVANKEAQRRTAEAFTHLWLVNFLPWSKSTWLIGVRGQSKMMLTQPCSEAHSYLGAWCHLPPSGSRMQGFRRSHPVPTLGDASEGSRMVSTL